MGALQPGQFASLPACLARKRIFLLQFVQTQINCFSKSACPVLLALEMSLLSPELISAILPFGVEFPALPL
jgi:hypothetical protein